MKSVKNLMLALVLVFAVAANVAAGEVPFPPAPPPPPTSQTLLITAEDTTQPSLDPNSEQSGDTSDYLLFEALAALLYLY